jgi:glycosyltransferase involved in cell wall biosynthesis
MTKGDEVICVSESIKDYVQRNYGKVPEKKLKVIHRGINQDEFPRMVSPTGDWLTNWYNNYPLTKNKKLLLIAGRITQLKGHECFLKLLSRLPDDFHGLVVGSIHPKRENYYRNLLKQVRKMNLEQRVTFTGACKDMKEIYLLSHATLSLSSKPESFGRTVLESLSCGCPVVGYGHGGVGEILKDCYPSGSIPFGNLKLVASSVMADSISDSKIEIPSHFKLDHMLDQILNSYYEILKISKI